MLLCCKSIQISVLKLCFSRKTDCITNILLNTKLVTDCGSSTCESHQILGVFTNSINVVCKHAKDKRGHSQENSHPDSFFVSRPFNEKWKEPQHNGKLNMPAVGLRNKIDVFILSFYRFIVTLQTPYIYTG